MSTQRIIAHLLTPSSVLLRFAAAQASSSLQPCHHVFRRLSPIQAAQMSSKRKMQTNTAYHPSLLGSQLPPPPRDADASNTSISEGIPQLNDIIPPEPAEQHENICSSSPEMVAQELKSVASPSKSDTSIAPTSPSKAKTRQRLRARKAAMNLTPGAVEQLRSMLDQPSPKLIKVGVRNRGCSGLTYHLEYVEKPGALDEIVEQDGVKVLIDSKALFSIIGSEMDWVEDKLSRRFVFKNPNTKGQCGCGESFMV